MRIHVCSIKCEKSTLTNTDGDQFRALPLRWRYHRNTSGNDSRITHLHCTRYSEAGEQHLLMNAIPSRQGIKLIGPKVIKGITDGRLAGQ